MKDYIIEDKIIKIILDNDKVVKVDKKWATETMSNLDTDLDDVLLMYLEDNDYLVNEAQEELDNYAKQNKVKLDAKEKTERKPVNRERKVNQDKVDILQIVFKTLQENVNFDNLNLENPSKIITFAYKNKQFKLDLTEKRVKKD